jgi:hypothetical protein
MSLKPISLTTTTTIDRDSHINTILALDLAAGFAVTLPEATGSGDIYRFVIKTTTTGAYTIAALTTDVIAGAVTLATTNVVDGIVAATSATSDKISMNGSTTGGLAGGTYIELIDALDATWHVTGTLRTSGAEATPFAAT